MCIGSLQRDGYCLLPAAIDEGLIEMLKTICAAVFEHDELGVRARSSRGHVYAARNLVSTVDEVRHFWQETTLVDFLRHVLGNEFGLVRALFFDKPPDRTWALGWHKDMSIAVKDNRLNSPSFSRPTLKAGTPHVIAADEILQTMVTLRVHLDEVTKENGPLRVIPQSHRSSTSVGVGADHAVDILAMAGDVLAMRPLITHGSGASIAGTRQHRRILHLEFAASRKLPDGFQWHDFVGVS